MVRAKIEDVITLLRARLQLSSTCGAATDALLRSLGDDTLFAKELSQYFVGGRDAIPFHITPSDPSQVAVLKKIINALALAKKGFKSIEDISVKSDRYTVGIVKDVACTAWSAVDEIYKAVQLLNTSSEDVQAIIGPHISGLLPKLGVASNALAQFAPQGLREPGTALAEDPASFSAKAVAAVVASLPTEVQTGSAGLANASSLIFSLPQYFELLQAQIDTGASQIPLKATTTAEGYQAEMLKRANRTKAQFERLASSSSSMMKIPSYISTVKELAAHGSELMSTGAPLTKVAYIEAVAKLNLIRHNILPRLVSELEVLEEGMALKPGSLVGPAVAQMESYYKQVAGYVDGIAQAAGVLDSAADMAKTRYGVIATGLMRVARPDVGEKLTPVANLDVLRDEVFEASTAKQRAERLVQAQLESRDDSKVKAADAFFSRIAGLTWWTHKWSLANATPEVKAALLADYKQFQEHFAAHNPALDRVIVGALSVTNEGVLLSRVINTDYRQMISSHMREIMDCRGPVIGRIVQASAQAAFKAKVIQEGDKYHAESFYAARDHETELQENTQAFAALPPFAVEEGLTAEEYGKKQLAVAVQLHNLEAAKAALGRFSLHLRTRHPAGDTKISELSAEEKETLRREYKAFQPYVVGSENGYVDVADEADEAADLDVRMVRALDSKLQVAQAALTEFIAHLTAQQHPDTSFRVGALSKEEKQTLRSAYKKFQPYVDATTNAKIVDALTADNAINNLMISDLFDLQAPLESKLTALIGGQQAGSNLQVHKLIHVAPAEGEEEGDDLSLQATLTSKLDELIRSSKEELGLYTTQAHVAKKAELNASPIVAMGDALDKKTLFGQLQALKFSATVGAFIRQQEPSARLPFKEFHKDSPDVQMRKKLINALHHLQGTLAKLEALDGQDPKYFLTRSWYMKSLLFVVWDVVAIKNSLTEASTNPGLTALIKEGYKMLEPLQGLPLIGDYLRNTVAPEQAQAAELDIVDQWEVEQGVIRRMRAGEALVVAAPPVVQVLPPIPAVVPQPEQGEADASTIRTIAEGLFSLPQRLRALHAGDAEPAPDGVEVIDASEASQEALIASLSGLSFGPGSLGKILQAVQTLNTQLTEVGTESRALAFRTIASLPASVGATLVAIADTAEFHMGLSKPGVLSSRLADQFKTFYDSLIENLPFRQDQEGLGLINSTALLDARIQNEEARRTALIDTQDSVARDARHFIAGELGVFQAMRGAEFETREQKVAFLREYATFQPYLVQINGDYDKSSFLCTLQTPSDFKAACNAIINLRPRLEELVESGIEGTRRKEIQRCDLRIAHFKAQRVEEVKEGDRKLKLFKESVSTHYLSANVRSRYQEQLGPYTAPFVAAIEKKFAEQRDDLLAPINMGVDIEAAIATRIDQEVVSQHFQLLDMYTALNTSLNTINDWIQAEESNTEGNPCRAEKLVRLRDAQQQLTQPDSFSADTSLDQVREDYRRAQDLITSMKEYNAMIKIHTKLQDMREHVASLPANEINAAKLAEITELQNTLKTGKTPHQRLQDVEERGMSEPSKQILLKNSDSKLVKLLKSFWSFLTGWQSTDEQKHGLFRTELRRMRAEAGTDPVAQNEAAPEVVGQQEVEVVAAAAPAAPADAPAAPADAPADAADALEDEEEDADARDENAARP